MAGETLYNTPAQGTPTGTASSIGSQAVMDYYFKKALIAVRDHQYFMPLADVRAMPKHMGKKIKQDVYVPLLDDLNINDQGINADGNVLDKDKWSGWSAEGVEQGYAYTSAELAQTGAGADGQIAQNGQNLYGSSKDTGTIQSKIPLLRENGGRVNRVGFTRRQIEGSLLKRGFFTEYTQESMDFDTDSELLSHIVEEALVGANELTEAELQNDLITNATANGTAFYCSGNPGVQVGGPLEVDCVADYETLMNLSIALDDAKCPKQTKIISGSRMIDTKTINGGRIMYVGSALIPVLRAMQDLHSQPAFVSVEK